MSCATAEVPCASEACNCAFLSGRVCGGQDTWLDSEQVDEHAAAAGEQQGSTCISVLLQQGSCPSGEQRMTCCSVHSGKMDAL
jgi:hypothetical protein